MPAPNPPLTHLSSHILLALADEVRHGYGIIKEIEARTDGAMSPSTGAVYLALQRMEQEGLIVESDDRPEPGEDDERRRYYGMTRQGRTLAIAESNRLEGLVAVARQKRLLGNLPADAALERGMADG
jgi:DNA-binding PadR family transcriptional regulator